MASFILKILRFSTFFKVLTIACLSGLILAYLAPFVHPNSFKLLPFFGLAYPIILACTLSLLLIWSLVRSRWALIILLIILIGGKLHFRMIAVGSNQKELPPDEQTLRVMSYNVRLFNRYSNEGERKFEKRDKIFEYVRSENPDIICFQEFYHQDKPTTFSTRDTLIKMLSIRDYHERYAHKMRGRQNFGVAILSKYPMIAKGGVMFETQGTKDFNYCIFTDIIKNSDTFRIYNVHLQSIRLGRDVYEVFNPDSISQKKKSTIRLMLDKLLIAYPKRADQAKVVMEHVLRSPYPTIVCGDFNDTPLSYAYNQFASVMIDAYRNCSTGIGSTYVGKVPAGRIDYIFHTSDLNSSHFKIQKEAYSDHRAISCNIFKLNTEQQIK